MTRIERAKQFMPFAALHGYEDTVRKKEFVKSPRRELTEEENANLTEIVSRIKKGDVIKAEYYAENGYTETEGAITEIDLQARYIRVVKTPIKFDDLYSIKEIK